MSELKFFDEYFENEYQETCIFSEIFEISKVHARIFTKHMQDYCRFFIFITDNAGFVYSCTLLEKKLGVCRLNFDCKNMEELEEKKTALSNVLRFSYAMLSEDINAELKAQLEYYQKCSSDVFSYDPKHSKFLDSVEYNNLYQKADNMVSEIVKHTEAYWKNKTD